MNELLTLVHDFNTKHKADAFFSYSGHVHMVIVSVNQAGTIYDENIKQVRLFDGTCYLDQDYGKYPTIKALTEAFRKFAEDYEE